MIENATSVSSIQSMLRTMAAYQNEAAGGLQGLGAPMPGAQVPVKPAAPGFSEAVERALGQVNEAQQKAKGLREAYEMGEP
ncbi:MAG: flagellar hook-basal body complex protein FliE, partial [Betaproteobacteria bacterium]|nr:flagellar hook-basal body complex protein FliE [Betaproteobacteria bacterium]